MADSKITALAALTTADPANDMFPVVDVSDTSMAASGTTKRISINNILACSPSATLASATITGAATVGTTLGVTGASTLASVGVTGAATVGTTLLVGTNATLTNGNVIIGTIGKGIDFSATSNGSGTMTSELLNDYEEGTWVPTVGGTSTYTGQTGSYIKVGRLVTVSFDMAILLLGTGSTATISGLPFVVGSATSPKCEQCHGAAGYFGSLAVNVYSLTFNANANTSTINSISMNTLGGTANVNPAIYGNGTRVQGTVTYIAA